MALEIAILFGILLALSHYFSERFHFHKKSDILSFAAGVSITYIFLHLLPQSFGESYGRLIFLSMLIGFSLFHVIEKHTFRHRTKRRRHELREVHGAAFFVYHLVIGVVLVNITSLGITEGVLFFIPILLHSSISSASLKEIHRSVKRDAGIRIILSASPLIGVAAAAFVVLDVVIYSGLLGFVAGALLYIVIRDELPKGRRGHSLYFVLGIFTYVLMLLAAFL